MQPNLHSTVLTLLQRIQSPQVQQAEAQLRQLSTHQSFYQVMFFIIANEGQGMYGSTAEWTKTTAATFLNSLFLDNLTDETVNQIFEALVQILLEPSIKQLDKRIFQKSIIRNIQKSTHQLQAKWMNVSLQCLNNTSNFDTAFLLIACLAVSQIQESPIPYIITNLYDKILTCIPVNIENAALLNEMIKMWIVILDKIKNDETIKHVTADMARNNNLYTFLTQIYEFQSGQNSLITFTQGLEELNFLKYEAAQLHKKILDVEIEQTEEAFPIVLDFTKTFLPKIANTLQIMASRLGQIERLGVEDLLTSLISIMRYFFLFNTEHFNVADVFQLLDTIIFPFLAANDQQRHIFEEEPVQFNTVTEDCCDNQQYGILKTQAASLLEKFGDRVDGCTHYALNRAIESIQIRMGHLQGNNYTLPVLEIETAFLVISIFSYSVSKYPEEIEKIKIILSDQKIYSLPPMETSRVFTFLAYNYCELYKNLSEGEHWLRYAINYSAHPTACYCAFDFFSNIVEDYFNQNLLDKITDHIAIGKMGLTWDIIYKILQNHFGQISTEGIINVISKVFIRLKKELDLLSRREKQDYMDLTNCFRTLMTILKAMRQELKTNPQSIALQTKKESLLKTVWPVLQLYETGRKYDVEDQVVKLGIEIINLLDTMVPDFKPYLNKFIDAYKASKYSEKIYLKFMNQYILKADFNKEMQQIISIMVCIKDSFLNVANKNLTQNGKQKSLPHYRLTLCDILIVLQNVVALFGSALVSNNNLEFFHEVSSICMRHIPNQNEQLQKTATSRILLSRIFNLLFLCHMHVRIDSIYLLLQRLKDARLYQNYDTKVLTICICKQIFHENDLTAINMLLSGLIDIVKLSDEKEEYIEKKKKKSKITADKVKDSTKAYEDFNRLIYAIDTPFKNNLSNKDFMIDMFRQMKHSNLELFNSTLQALSHETFQKYTQYVDFQQLEKKRIIRKVIGVKMGGPNNIDVQIHPRSSQMNDSDDDNASHLKRQRVHVKKEDKKAKTVKSSKKKVRQN